MRLRITPLLHPSPACSLPRIDVAWNSDLRLEVEPMSVASRRTPVIPVGNASGKNRLNPLLVETKAITLRFTAEILKPLALVLVAVAIGRKRQNFGRSHCVRNLE